MKPTRTTRLAACLAPAFSLLLMAGAASAQNYGPPQQRPDYQRPDNYGPAQPWESAPPEFRQAMQRGFHDGIEGARRDFQNHRPPNVNNRDEYRDPRFIPRPERRDYRMAFRRGYDVGVQHIYGRGQGDGGRGQGYGPGYDRR